MHIWRALCLRIFLVIFLRLDLIVRSAVSASPCVDESQRFSIPYLVHQQKTNGNEGDDDERKSRSTFGERDNENDNGDNDLHNCVQMNSQITLDTSW